LSGKLRTGFPVAAKMALSTAGATTQMVGSRRHPKVVGWHDHCFDLGHLRKTHDLVGVEVEICHPAVLDRHFAIERGGETEGHRSLHLGLDLAWIDCMTAIERQHHAMNF
jgi:hypothetical protein